MAFSWWWKDVDLNPRGGYSLSKVSFPSLHAEVPGSPYPRILKPRGSLLQRRKAMMVARKQRDIIYKGDDKSSWECAKMAFTEPFIYISAVLLFRSPIPLFGFGTFLPRLKGLEWTITKLFKGWSWLLVTVILLSSLTTSQFLPIYSPASCVHSLLDLRPH